MALTNGDPPGILIVEFFGEEYMPNCATKSGTESRGSRLHLMRNYELGP